MATKTQRIAKSKTSCLFAVACPDEGTGGKKLLITFPAKARDKFKQIHWIFVMGNSPSFILMQLVTIQQKIYNLRGHKVMLDFDLAALYQVETRVLNQSVKRNLRRSLITLCFD